MRRLTVLLLLGLSATAAGAAERRVFVSSFDRIRVEGPFAVTLTIGRAPGGAVTGDARAVDAVEVRQDGATLVVRGAIGEQHARPERDDKPPRFITLATPTLASTTVVGGGQLTVVGGRAQRLDLAVTGPGAITLTGADVDQLTATVIGAGTIVAAGRAAKARLSINGAGAITADKLDAGELIVRVDGPGEATARARYTAGVTNTGLGHVTVAGAPKCDVRNPAGGPVRCGTGR